MKMKAKKNSSLLIKNINLLTMKSEEISRNQMVEIDNGVIKTIREMKYDLPNSETVIDGQGDYLLPGLINMHTHLGDNPDDLILYLTNGITTIRNMWGYEDFKIKHWLFGIRLFNHLDLKRKIENQELIGPNIFTAGPLLDGAKPFLPKFMPLHSLKNSRQVAELIRKQATKGYDFIKVYHMLSEENFQEIIKVARENNIPVAGHVPDAVGVERVLKSKVKSIEHLYGFVNPYRPELNTEQDDIKRLANLAATNEVWNCPTLVAHERLANIGRREEFENEYQMNYVNKRNKKAMRFLIKQSNELYQKKGLKGNHEYLDQLIWLVQELKREGAGVLLGTDKAVPYVVAGFSEYLEMELLSEAGLSNYEVIETATINAAKCLGKDKEIGTIEIGKKADLIIVKDNPLQNLKALRNHDGVIKDGIWYSREKCDQLLKEIMKKIDVN